MSHWVHSDKLGSLPSLMTEDGSTSLSTSDDGSTDLPTSATSASAKHSKPFLKYVKET